MCNTSPSVRAYVVLQTEKNEQWHEKWGSVNAMWIEIYPLKHWYSEFFLHYVMKGKWIRKVFEINLIIISWKIIFQMMLVSLYSTGALPSHSDIALRKLRKKLIIQPFSSKSSINSLMYVIGTSNRPNTGTSCRKNRDDGLSLWGLENELSCMLCHWLSKRDTMSFHSMSLKEKPSNFQFPGQQCRPHWYLPCEDHWPSGNTKH